MGVDLNGHGSCVIFIPRLTKFGQGYGVASDVRPAISLSVRISFSEQISKTYAHIHPLGSVDVLFKIYEF